MGLALRVELENAMYMIGATIEARMTSSRFYGKVMAPIFSIPMLEHLVYRVKLSSNIQHITIATTTNSQDDVIEQLSKRLGINVYRGSENDVLGRVIGAATEARYEVLVRLTGDNPLYSAELIDAMVEFYLNNDYDLVANAAMAHTDKWKEERTFPLGLGIQILKVSLLKKIGASHLDALSREHVTLPILSRPDLYKLGAFRAEGKFKQLNRPNYRLTVDTRDDFQLMEEIFKELYPENQTFSIESVIDILDRRPDMVAKNVNIKQIKPGVAT